MSLTVQAPMGWAVMVLAGVVFLCAQLAGIVPSSSQVCGEGRSRGC